MPLTDRMLIGAIASNPAAPAKAGEARYCRTCDQIYFTTPKEPGAEHAAHDTLALPALNPDGSGRLAAVFQAFIKRWPAERQDELERFALRKGWDLAYELRYGGGALSDEEAAEWQAHVDKLIAALVIKARQAIGSPGR